MRQDIKKKIVKNIVFGFGGQLLILVISIVIPRLIIVSYGSDTNGLTSAITQIFSYLALLEAGIGNASVNLLYKNIAANDKNAISDTISATRRYFNKILPVYIVCVAIFAVVYPEIINTDVAHSTVRLIIIIQGLSSVVDFAFTNTFTQMLIADGRNYVSANLNLMVKVLAAISQIVLINCGFNIICVQASYLVFYIIKAVIINAYVKKNYSWVDAYRKVPSTILAQRNSFVIHEISAVVFSSTDVFVLSIFCSMKIASVYTVYNLVFTALSTYISVFNKGIDFTLGHEYNRNKETYIRLHDTYEAFYMCLVFTIITTAYILILPFVTLYTRGVTDINYVDKWLPLLFALIHLLSCGRAVSAKLITIADHAQQTVPRAIFEDIINLAVSLVLVMKIGVYGVLIGTIVALLYRMNDIVFYANKKILHRNPRKVYRNLLIDFSIFFVVVVISSKVNLQLDSYLSFLLAGIVVVVVTSVTYFSINCMLNRSLFSFIKNNFSKIIRKQKVG